VLNAIFPFTSFCFAFSVCGYKYIKKMLLALPPWPPAESAGHQLHEKYTIK